MIDPEIIAYVERALAQSHNGVDGPKIDKVNFTNIAFQYNAKEFDNGSVTGTAVIDWGKSNVQYVTLTGNTTLTFSNPRPGMRCILQVAGAFTPTFPGTVRWSGGTTPTATATSGKKDVYSFVYSGKESLYDGIQSNNFATT
jgi:hypothetical protein